MTEKGRFHFWYRWLLFVSLLNVVIGLVIAWFPASKLFELHTTALGANFFNGTLPGEAEEMRRFFYGITGGTIAGYFLLQTMIVLYPFRRRERWAWHAVLWAILLWFVTDSTLSMLHGALFNVWMINIPSLVLTLLPLLMTYRYFHH